MYTFSGKIFSSYEYEKKKMVNVLHSFFIVEVSEICSVVIPGEGAGEGK